MRDLQGYGCRSRRGELHPSERHCFLAGMLAIGTCMHIVRHQRLRQLPAASKPPGSKRILVYTGSAGAYPTLKMTA